jgi:chitin-binding protein
VTTNSIPRAAKATRVVAALALLAAALVLPSVLAPAPAAAHGAMTLPASRTYMCRLDGTHPSGDIIPNNPACTDAIAMGNKQPLWDWFGVLRSDGGGRTEGYIPDGQLCSGGNEKYAGYDQARGDWPYTSLTGGSEVVIRYNGWAAHPGEFRLYVTKPGYDPTQSLGWDDLEAAPFSTYSEQSPNGTDEVNSTPDYQWTAVLPDRSGPHVIYSVWERSDSSETFYGCSDVNFDGGSGEIVGIGSDGAALLASQGTPAAEAETTGTTAAGGAAGEEAAATGPAAPAGEIGGETSADAATEAAGDPAAVQPANDQASAASELAPGETGTSAATTAASGLSLTSVLVVGLIGVVIGVVLCVAVYSTVQLGRLRALLDRAGQPDQPHPPGRLRSDAARPTAGR